MRVPTWSRRPTPTTPSSTPRSPHHETCPDQLAALGLLLGLDPAPVARCRVLEIGCATAGNLFGLAEAWPDAQFVGIDPSPRQIEIGRGVAAAIGLTNLRLEAVAVESLDDSWGKFDYILCHGVYSWVPPAAREAILDACRRLLAPQGIAYVSYNAKPGWHLRLPVRDMMLWHVRDIADPHQRIAQSRNILTFVAGNVIARDSAWAKLVGEECALAVDRSDFYLAHEHLEEENEAFYFHEFIAAARRHGLKYLAEAIYHTNIDALPPEVRQALEGMSEDLVAMEQYVDFLKGRMFRRTLLIHQEVALNRSPKPEILDKLHLSALVRPVPDEVPIGPGEAVEFKSDDGASVETNRPVLKAALMELYARWPLALSWDDLWQGTAARLSAADIEPTDEGRAVLASSLATLLLSNLVSFHAAPSPFTTTVSQRPMASRLARAQASGDVAVCNRRHRQTKLDGFCLALLPLLDGTRDASALAEELLKRVDPEKATPEQAREAIAADLEPSLERLAPFRPAHRVKEAMRPDSQQGLMPSLLDRLIDPEATGTALRQGYGLDQMAQAVLRDLEELLNTRLTTLDLPDDCVELRASVAAFGMPDLSNVPAATTQHRAAIGRTLETIIMRFEPRLRDVRATLVVEKNVEKTRSVRFLLAGKLRVDPSPEVAFDTVLELTTGRSTVSPLEKTP